MNELELCVKANVDFDKLIKIMNTKGFHIQEDFQMNDIYMIKDEIELSYDNRKNILNDYLLIRETVGKKIMLVLKHKVINNKNEIISQKSIKCPIVDVDKGYDFMKALNYKKIFELKDHNILLSNGKNEIYIQDVEGLGTYIEMEQNNLLLKNNNGNDIDEMIKILNGYDLPFDKSNYFVKKSEDMLKKIDENLNNCNVNEI